MVRPRIELDVVHAFRAPRILTLEQLCRRMRASRSTVLRRLDEHGWECEFTIRSWNWCKKNGPTESG